MAGAGSAEVARKAEFVRLEVGGGEGESEAGERIPGGPVARRNLARAVRSCGSECLAAEMREVVNHSPRTASMILSASMSAVW